MSPCCFRLDFDEVYFVLLFILLNLVFSCVFKLFTKISKTMRLNIIGIDFMSLDIRKSYKDNFAKINEVNGTPSLDLHYFADNKLKTHIHNKILKMYFNIK